MRLKKSASSKNFNNDKTSNSFLFTSNLRRMYDVCVIGGGIIGLSVARKLAKQGYSVIIIEKGEIGSGTSGHFHELLHSGARYALNDPFAAIECYEENRVLCDRNSSVKNAIVQTGGLFLAITESDVSYSEKLITACKSIGIPIDEINIQNVISQEPRISKQIKRALRVPDAFINGKKVLQINKNIAQEYGVDILVHHKVIGFYKPNAVIEAVGVQNDEAKEQLISCGFVINAAGAWAERIGKLIDIDIPIAPYRGALIEFQGLLCKSVLNRCRKPSNGDIFVPADTSTIFGTTAKITNNIDNLEAEKTEIELLLQQGEQLIPGLSDYPIIKKYAGVRPLSSYDTQSVEGRDISRSFVIINHKENDGIANFISVIGGKFTIYERMSDKAIEVFDSMRRSSDKSNSNII